MHLSAKKLDNRVKAILLGQNSTITFMLFVLIWRYTSVNKQYLAGIFMGLLVYKPQFAIPIMGLFVISGRYKIAIISVLTICIVIVGGLFFTGTTSYMQWFHFLKWFIPADASHNGINAVSWIGFLDAIFGANNKISTIVGYACCSMTIVVVTYIWGICKNNSDLKILMGFAAVSLVLIPPHVMYYDAGLIILTYAVIMDKIYHRKYQLIIFIWLVGIMQAFADKIGFSPLFFLVIITYVISVGYIAIPLVKNCRVHSKLVALSICGWSHFINYS